MPERRCGVPCVPGSGMGWPASPSNFARQLTALDPGLRFKKVLTRGWRWEMTRKTVLFLLVGVLIGHLVAAADYLLPGFAWHLPGKAFNTWTSELYVTNTDSAPAEVLAAGLLSGRSRNEHPCLPVIRPLEIPPHSTVLVTAEQLSRDLGCFDQLVGGLVFSGPTGIVIGSRMINHLAGDFGLLSGLGQEIPATPFADLPRPGVTYMLPALAADSIGCTTSRVESYVSFANPESSSVEISLTSSAKSGLAIVGNGLVGITPFRLQVPARGWVQIRVAKAPPIEGGCGSFGLVDLAFETTGPVGVLGSVVDRSSQDPRTVLPVAWSPREP